MVNFLAKIIVELLYMKEIFIKVILMVMEQGTIIKEIRQLDIIKVLGYIVLEVDKEKCMILKIKVYTMDYGKMIK